MVKPIIEVENLFELYHLGIIGATTFRNFAERRWYRMRGKEERTYYRKGQMLYR